MNNAIHVKNELFDRSVSEALISTTNRLENMQDFRMINHFAFGDSTHFRNFTPIPPPPPRIPGGNQKRFILPKSPERPTAQQIQMIVKAGKNKNGIQYHISSKRDSSQKGEEENIIIVNTDSLNSIYSKGINRFDSLTGQFDQWTDSASGIRRRFEIKTHKLKRMANKVVQEISTWGEDVPIDRVNEVLKKELENRNIPIPFELGIIKDSIIKDKSANADTSA